MASVTGTEPDTMTVTEAECRWAMLGYLGAIFFGPVAPLIVRFSEGRRSPFVRRHVTQSLNLTLTFLLYLLSAVIIAGLLAVDSLITALAIMGPIVIAAWLFVVVQLVRCAIAADRASFREPPSWMCAPIVGSPRSGG
jgi:uncharacterized Tic20 family protein